MDATESLERELRERRDDLDLWQVYADHLATTDPSLAQWIALHLAKDRGAEVSVEIRELYGEIIGGELSALGTSSDPNYRTSVRLTFAHGFIDHAELVLAQPSGFYDGSTECRLPGLHALFSTRATRFLRQLDLRVWDDTDAEIHGEGVLDALAQYSLRSLEVLNVRLDDLLPTERMEANAGFVIPEATCAAVFRAAPRLDEFLVRWADGKHVHRR